MTNLIEEAVNASDVVIWSAYTAGQLDKDMPVESCRKKIQEILTSALSRQRSEIADEIEGMDVRRGFDRKSWLPRTKYQLGVLCADDSWRSQRDSLVKKLRDDV